MPPGKKNNLNGYEKDKQEFKKPELFKIWNFLIIRCFLAMGFFLVY